MTEESRRTASGPSRARASWDTREEQLALVERICGRIREGTHVNHACALEGLHKQRLYEWLPADEEIAALVAEARAVAAELMRGTVLAAAMGGAPSEGVTSPNANVLLHLLERSHPDEYAPPKTRIEATGENGGPIKHEATVQFYVPNNPRIPTSAE